MSVAETFVRLGEDAFGQLLRGISIGRLKTFRVYEGLRASAHLHKLNTESLRKGQPRFWARLAEGDEEFAKDLAQAVLVSHIDMIVAILDFLGVPHENGFFAKDVNAASFLTEGWQRRVYDQFRTVYAEPLLLFYINHLAWELAKSDAVFTP